MHYRRRQLKVDPESVEALFEKPLRWKLNGKFPAHLRDPFVDPDTSYPYRNTLIFFFTTKKGVKYKVDCTIFTDADGDYLNRGASVEFSNQDAPSRTAYKITDTGDAFAVLATVADIIKWVVEEVEELQEIIFTAEKDDPGDGSDLEESTRFRVYRNMVNKLTKNFADTVVINEDPGKYYFFIYL